MISVSDALQSVQQVA